MLIFVQINQSKGSYWLFEIFRYVGIVLLRLVVQAYFYGLKAVKWPT